MDGASPSTQVEAMAAPHGDHAGRPELSQRASIAVLGAAADPRRPVGLRRRVTNEWNETAGEAGVVGWEGVGLSLLFQSLERWSVSASASVRSERQLAVVTGQDTRPPGRASSECDYRTI